MMSRICFHDYDNCNRNRCGFTFSNVIVCQHSLFQSLRAVGGLMKNEDETEKLNENTVVFTSPTAEINEGGLPADNVIP
jgi:hypothetical protein